MDKSTLFSALEDVAFAEKSPDIITSNIIKFYEDSANRTLSRADPVRLFIDAIILTIIQQRNVIDFAAKQNLLAYAQGRFLDHIGALLGVTRLTPAHAVCTLQATLPQSLPYPVTIPAGTRLAAGSILFATTQELTLQAGTLSDTVSAQCTQEGSIGNGFAAGQIRKLVDVLPFAVSIENITDSNGGTDTEEDEPFRERIQMAPESFSVAGPVKAYEYFARSADTDIIDVAVLGPSATNLQGTHIVSPGCVEIFPLMTDGTLPSDEVIARVYEACNADRTRPDTDYVTVKKPSVINYSLGITYWIDEANSVTSSAIQSAVVREIDNWIVWQRKALGRDINPSELVKRVVSAGAKRCEVSSPTFRALEAWQIAVCNSQNVIYAGLERG